MFRFKRKWLLICLCTVLAVSCFGLAACQQDDTPPAEQPVAVQSITITGAPNGSVSLETGSVQLRIESTPSGDAVLQFSVAWSSNAQAVAAVDKNGLVTLQGADKATITASVIGMESVKDSVWFEVEWTSAGESVTVTEQGVVTAVSVGGGTVTATVKGTFIAAQCAVTVVAPLDPLCEDFD